MRKIRVADWFVIYVLVLGGFLGLCVFGSKTIATMGNDVQHEVRKCIIIDAGHGGVDGGTTSCSGVTESTINLEIALRLNDLLHLLGMETKTIRTTDCSVYTSGETIAAKKVSDLKERVRIVESTEKGILVSIHQNYFTQSVYSGAQVFYNQNNESVILAKNLQRNLIATVNPGSKRSVKNATGVYLMEHVTCPAILIECGFLSNPTEDVLLQDPDYQKKLCCVISSTLSEFVNSPGSKT